MSSWGIFSSHDYAGVDQGVDFRGGGQIPALDSAVVTDVGSASIIEEPGRTYPYVVYRLTSGPYKGSFVYTAENFHPTVRRGQKLKQGQSIGVAPGRYPFIEIGFNKTPTGWNAVAPLGGATPAGAAMKSYIFGLIGSAPPVTVPDVGAGYTGPTGAGSGGPGVSSVVGAAKGAVSAAESTASFFSEISSASFWIRALEVIGGGLLVIMGLYLLTRQVGLAQAPAPPPRLKEGADSISQTFSEAPGIDAYQPAYRRSTEGVKRDVVRHDVSEQGARQKEVRRRSELAQPSEEVPF